MMPKKIDEAEVKKECPSCGLGVALDATVCEFCGWDFEEEDEWILQIEKLERDLMMEKGKFEPGSVNDRIDATLHTPADAMKAIKSAQKPEEAPQPEPVVTKPVQVKPQPPVAKPVARPAPAPAPRPVEKKTAPPPAAKPPEQKVRRVRTVKGSDAEAEGGGLVSKAKPAAPAAKTAGESAPPEGAPKKVRLVRKIK